METDKFLCSMETDKFYDKFYYNYVVWKLLNFMLINFMQYGNLKFNIKEVAHQSKSAVTSKKLHKIYIDVTFYYENNTIIGE